jgi:peptidyl-prolyl cis-trans isomerase SurA
MATPTDEEIKTAKRNWTVSEPLLWMENDFKDAAFRFSDDKRTKFNGGYSWCRRFNKIERESIPGTISYELAGLKKGDITTAFEDEENKRKVVKIIKIEDEIPAHQITLETDYDRIKQMALNKRKMK